MGSEQSSRRQRDDEFRDRDYRKEAQAATAKDVEQALEKQRKMYEKKMAELLRVKGTNNTATVAGHQPNSTTNLDRQSAPYSYNQNELQGAVFSPTTHALYPNLGSGYSTLSPGSPGCQNVYGGNNQGNPFVNHYQVPPSPQRFPPTAPPVEVPSPSNNLRLRPRSTSSQRGQANQDDDITCRTCEKLYEDRIYQCNQGHSSCNSCKMRQVACGQCRQQLTNRRNYDLEKYVAERRVKCTNWTNGCSLYIKMGDMAIHVKECPFKVLMCPSLGGYCSWSGMLTQLSEHFDAMHPTHRQGDVDKEMYLSDICNTSHTMHFVQIGSFNFLFHLKVSMPESRIYMTVQLIGTKHSAAKWNYEIHVYNKSEPRRKFQFIDRCSSNSETIQEVIDSMQCAVLPQEYAKTFICNGVLVYKFYIKRYDDMKTTELENSYKGRKPRRYGKTKA